MRKGKATMVRKSFSTRKSYRHYYKEISFYGEITAFSFTATIQSLIQHLNNIQ